MRSYTTVLLFLIISLGFASCSDPVTTKAKELAKIKCDAEKEYDQAKVFEENGITDKYTEHTNKGNEILDAYNKQISELQKELSEGDYEKLHIAIKKNFDSNCK